MIFRFLVFIFIFFSLHKCIQRENSDTVAAGISTILNAPEGIGLLGTNLQIGNIGWTRGCETRTGNFIADAFAWKTGAVVGFMNGGGIRHDRGVNLIAEGTQITQTLLDSFMPFSNAIQLINLNGYRLKQALEGGYNRLQTNSTFRSTENNDSFGPQHGNCYGVVGDLEGSGRFLHVSSRIQIEVNPFNPAQTVTGTAGANSLQVTNEGRRVTRIIVDGVIIYNNSTGNPVSGWINSNSSCTVKLNTFVNSSACNRYNVAINNFYAGGGDENPSFNPDLPEINNDGSVIVLNSNLGVDKAMILEYSLLFTRIIPRIEGRILLP